MSVLQGIDVSYAQGKIDWAKLKGKIDFAIIRCGFGSNYTNQDDSQWLNNVKGCEANGIPYGVYLYSYATTIEKV
jgi:GH25 family lysozyme M1 (1,4-beta-N-acetylmuramidase)